MEDHANAALMRDDGTLWECAQQLFYTRMGGATIAAQQSWQALAEEERASYAREAIEIQRVYSKSLAHLPAPNFTARKEHGPLLSG